MELGLFMQPLHNPKRFTKTEMIDQDRDVALYIDSLGFDEFFVGEHHSSNFQPITSPLVFLASIIHDTKMKLGTGVINLPCHHPAQVASEVALFDHMSKGRFIMGVGPGGTPTDAEVFGARGKNHNEMLNESIEMIHKIWSSEPPYHLGGKYWNFQIDDSINMEVGYGPILKPYQQSYPPIFTSILSPNSRSAFVAGERGWSIMSANFAQSACVKTHWNQYALGCENAGRRPDRKYWRIARDILIADTDSAASEYLAELGNSYLYYYQFVSDALKSFNGTSVLKAHKDLSDEDLTAQYCLDTMVLSGSAKTVLDKLIDFTDLMGGPFGALTLCFKEWEKPEVHKRSMRLLAEDVMPKLRAYCMQTVAAE
jgi:alkanesulfonate monooxygenase SsuD/methylene tetrahydromethanopterin reductase-like flavin-dependent oxidoreductase (luciferase family)